MNTKKFALSLLIIANASACFAGPANQLMTKVIAVGTLATTAHLVHQSSTVDFDTTKTEQLLKNGIVKHEATCKSALIQANKSSIEFYNQMKEAINKKD